MNIEKTLSIISIILLITITGFSFILNSKANEEYLCKGDFKCIENIIKINKNTSLCNESEKKGGCFELFAIEFENSSLCEKSSDKDLCIARYAVLKNNSSICSKSLTPDLCIFQVASNNYNPNACENAKDKGLCYYSYAVKYYDIKICDKSEKYKSVCIEKIVGANENN